MCCGTRAAARSRCSGEYQAAINGLAALAPGAPGANTWNVTFWDSGAPPAGAFDVLVTMSEEGYWSNYPDYTDLNAAVGSSADHLRQPHHGDRAGR